MRLQHNAAQSGISSSYSSLVQSRTCLELRSRFYCTTLEQGATDSPADADPAIPAAGSRTQGDCPDMARSLVEDAEKRTGDEHGWLFPRHRSRTRWADQAGNLMAAAAQACGWDWSFHWLCATRGRLTAWLPSPQGDTGCRLPAALGGSDTPRLRRRRTTTCSALRTTLRWLSRRR
jgi:hypothetical protein